MSNKRQTLSKALAIAIDELAQARAHQIVAKDALDNSEIIVFCHAHDATKARELIEDIVKALEAKEEAQS